MVCGLYVHCVLTKLWELLSLSVRTTKIEIWYQLIVIDLKKESTHILLFTILGTYNKKWQIFHNFCQSCNPLGHCHTRLCFLLLLQSESKHPPEKVMMMIQKFLEKCELLFLKTEALSQPACTLPKLIGWNPRAVSLKEYGRTQTTD